MMESLKKSRFKVLFTLVVSFVIISFVTRLVLISLDYSSIDFNVITLIKMFSVGFMYDLLTSTYYFIPLALYLLFVTKKFYNTKVHYYILFSITAMIMFAMLFNVISEYFFWEEFGKRFNFIAVDYLVYTHEVINNIKESYPLPTILSSLFVGTLVVVFLGKKQFFIERDESSFMQRAKIALPLLLLPVIVFNLFDKQALSNVSDNIYNNELAKNGTYSLFSAFRHNELQYDKFYKTLDIKEVYANLEKLEDFDNKRAKIVTSTKQETNKNIILIMVESLSAEYMGIYGNKKNLTPHLDMLAKKSLFFNNLYATGTRTVRGMEAVTLSFPPTPGRSIVKRPKNGNLDSIGRILESKGYENNFIYAGHGYFDNMNDFFANNGFNIVDRLSFKEDEITFSNVWGVCDEDLFNKTLSQGDKAYQNKKPFFSFVMTTSNHRPYTYPDNKVDIPSHTGRDGAVKYTDYSIDEFIKNAQKKPWFKDTVFIIVADHNGGSAGKNSLPLYRYKIPLIVYAPEIIEPKIITKLSSQIDTMPTIFALLGMDYKAHFYGNNILATDYVERAFIGNYQKLGFVKGDYVYYLSPDAKAHKMKVNNLTINSVNYEDEKITSEEEKELITYYQSASDMYENSDFSH